MTVSTCTGEVYYLGVHKMSISTYGHPVMKIDHYNFMQPSYGTLYITMPTWKSDACCIYILDGNLHNSIVLHE